MSKEILKSEAIRFNDKIRIIKLMANYKKYLLHPVGNPYTPPNEDESIHEYQTDNVLNSFVHSLFIMIREGLEL